MRRGAEIAAIGLALGMLTSPSAPIHAQEPTPIVRSKVETSESGEYQIPIALFERFVDINSNPITSELYEKINNDPQGHVTIVDPLGYGEFYIPGVFSYLVYNDVLTEEESPDFRNWSVLMGVEDLGNGTEKASISFQLNYSGHVYTGFRDMAAPGQLPISTKALQADYLFNIPEEMQTAGWLPNPQDPTSYVREYLDPKLGFLTQRVNTSNVVTLEATYLKPE